MFVILVMKNTLTLLFVTLMDVNLVTEVKVPTFVRNEARRKIIQDICLTSWQLLISFVTFITQL